MRQYCDECGIFNVCVDGICGECRAENEETTVCDQCGAVNSDILDDDECECGGDFR